MASPSTTARRSALSIVLWAFGLATTVFLIGMWGRSVSADDAALEEAFRAVAEADAATDRIQMWITEALVAGSSISEADDARVAAAVAQADQTEGVVGGVVSALVDAALEVPGSNPRADVRRALEPLSPLIASQLASTPRGTAEAEVAVALDRVAEIVGASDSRLAIGSTAADAERALTRVAVISAFAMLIFGMAALWLSGDRVRQARSLATRIAVSGFTFAIVLRVGAWAVDPGGGRAPIAEGSAVLLRSNSGVLLVIAAVGLGVFGALSGALVFRLRRRRIVGMVPG